MSALWLADATADLPAALAAYAAALPETLKQAEIEKNITLAKTQGSLAKPYITAVHMTVQEGGAALRAYYKNIGRRRSRLDRRLSEYRHRSTVHERLPD